VAQAIDEGENQRLASQAAADTLVVRKNTVVINLSTEAVEQSLRVSLPKVSQNELAQTVKSKVKIGVKTTVQTQVRITHHDVVTTVEENRLRVLAVKLIREITVANLGRVPPDNFYLGTTNYLMLPK
jgi:hypothetical protein